MIDIYIYIYIHLTCGFICFFALQYIYIYLQPPYTQNSKGLAENPYF